MITRIRLPTKVIVTSKTFECSIHDWYLAYFSSEILYFCKSNSVKLGQVPFKFLGWESTLMSKPLFHGSAYWSTKSALTEAGNSVLMASASEIHGLAANFYFSACILNVTKAFYAYKVNAEIRKRGIVIVSAEFAGKQSHEIGPRSETRIQILWGILKWKHFHLLVTPGDIDFKEHLGTVSLALEK